MTLPARARVCALIAFALLATACKEDETLSYARGRGLHAKVMAPAEQADVYYATLRGLFELRDPSLSLMLDGRLLPRDAGRAVDDTMPSAVASALIGRPGIKGSCQPPVRGPARMPECPGNMPGYVVRFSNVLAMPADSVEVYLAVEQFAVPGSKPAPAFWFERVYQLVRRPTGWKAVREGHVGREISKT